MAQQAGSGAGGGEVAGTEAVNKVNPKINGDKRNGCIALLCEDTKQVAVSKALCPPFGLSVPLLARCSATSGEIATAQLCQITHRGAIGLGKTPVNQRRRFRCTRSRGVRFSLLGIMLLLLSGKYHLQFTRW
jgi:hypothetical protein